MPRVVAGGGVGGTAPKRKPRYIRYIRYIRHGTKEGAASSDKLVLGAADELVALLLVVALTMQDGALL